MDGEGLGSALHLDGGLLQVVAAAVAPVFGAGNMGSRLEWMGKA